MGTPIPKIGRDSPTSSEIKTYKLSEEELAKYQNGRNKPMPKAPITKDQYLEMRKSGMSRAKVTRELKTNPPTLYAWLGEWGIRDLTVEEGILLEMSSTKPVDKPWDNPDAPLEGNEENISTTYFPNNPSSAAVQSDDDTEWFFDTGVPPQQPTVSVFKRGISFNLKACELIGISSEKTGILVGLRAGKLVIRKRSNGLSIKARKSGSVEIINRRLVDWLKQKQIEFKRYPITQSEEADEWLVDLG